MIQFVVVKVRDETAVESAHCSTTSLNGDLLIHIIPQNCRIQLTNQSSKPAL